MSTLSTTGKFVTAGLTTEKDDRLTQNDIYENPVGIASTVVDRYQVVSRELDIEVLNNVSATITIINDKKNQLIGLGNIAAGPFKAGVFPPICGLFSNDSDIDNNVNSGNGTIEAVDGGIGGGTTTPAVAYSVVRGDYVRIERYPYLEARTSPNNDALSGMKFPILNGGNAGQGKEDIYFMNSQYTDEDAGITYYVIDDAGTWNVQGFDDVEKDGDILGVYYPVDPTGTGTSVVTIPGQVSAGSVFSPDSLYTGISSFFTGIQTGTWTTGFSTGFSVEWNVLTGQLEPLVGPFIASGTGKLTIPNTTVCAGIAASQTALQNDIDTLRTSINPYFTSANTTKITKHAAQLKLWSATRVKTRNREEAQGYNNFQRDLEVAIPTVETVDPQLPTNRDTADNTTITADNTLITADSR
mgnify:CR=1 FL=1